MSENEKTGYNGLEPFPIRGGVRVPGATKAQTKRHREPVNQIGGIWSSKKTMTEQLLEEKERLFGKPKVASIADNAQFTDAEIDLITEMHSRGCSIKEIKAVIKHMSYQAIYGRVKKLKEAERNNLRAQKIAEKKVCHGACRPRLTMKEVEFIENMLGKGCGSRQIQRRFAEKFGGRELSRETIWKRGKKMMQRQAAVEAESEESVSETRLEMLQREIYAFAISLFFDSVADRREIVSGMIAAFNEEFPGSAVNAEDYCDKLQSWVRTVDVVTI